MTQDEQIELLRKIWNDGKWGDYCNPNKFYDLTPTILFYHINNLLTKRQEKMIEAMEKSKDKFVATNTNDEIHLKLGFNHGLDKAIEIIKNDK